MLKASRSFARSLTRRLGAARNLTWSTLLCRIPDDEIQFSPRKTRCETSPESNGPRNTSSNRYARDLTRSMSVSTPNHQRAELSWHTRPHEATGIELFRMPGCRGTRLMAPLTKPGVPRSRVLMDDARRRVRGAVYAVTSRDSQEAVSIAHRLQSVPRMISGSSAARYSTPKALLPPRLSSHLCVDRLRRVSPDVPGVTTFRLH